MGTEGRDGVRGKAGFTHDMNHFGRDVRRKRFSAHGTHEKEIDNRMEGRGKLKKKKSGAFHKGPDPYIKRT